MKTSYRSLMVAVLMAVALGVGSGTAQAQDAQTCPPGLTTQYFGPNNANYNTLIAALVPFFGELSVELAAVVNQATYQTLLDTANTLAASVPTGRVLITVPDGTVMIDTARDDNTVDPRSNSYQHFLDKTINENHNSRLAILGAQEYPCGVGMESKFSTSTGQTESYLALRAGEHLDSDGTIRMSIRQ